MSNRIKPLKIATRNPHFEIVNEPVFNEFWLWFMYYTPIGVALRYVIFRNRFFSNIYGILNRSNKSTRKIRSFIKNYNIEISELDRPIESFLSFDEFFTRKLRVGARPIDMKLGVLISPADARVIKYEMKEDCVLPVKGRSFTLEALLGKAEMAQAYVGGTVIVLRLAPFDYHRFCYIDDATVGNTWTSGRLCEAVHPYALWANAKSFTVNVRDCSLLHTTTFGDVLHVDVGALGVGAITQLNQSGTRVVRGQEKGFFSLGGSTIILVFKPGAVVMDSDIEANSNNGIETLVRYGESIGFRKN
jgi:phosphatidylserine decarboxylase